MKRKREARGVLGLLALLTMVGCGAAGEEASGKQARAQSLASGPDFVISEVTGPASAELGSHITVQARVCNQGTVTGTTRVDVYVSADRTITPPASSGPPEDEPLGQGYSPSLAPLQCVTMSLTGTVFSPYGSPGEGGFYLGAVADPQNAVAETREDNNALAGDRFGVGSKPDFVITDVSGPDSALAGDRIPIDVRVCNQGITAAATDVEVYMSADKTIQPRPPSGPALDTLLAGAATPVLIPGQCTTLSLNGTAAAPYGAPPLGAYYLGAVVDPASRTAEIIEDNNARTGDRMGMGSRPDFVVTEVTGPASATRGQSITAQATVCNQGLASASAPVELYLSSDKTLSTSEDTRMAGGTSPTLAPGQCATLSLNGKATPSSSAPPEGTFYLAVVVDPGNQVPELIEDNNTRVSARLGLGSKPDLVITAVTGPTSVLKDQGLTAQVTVCNQGTVSGSASVDIYLSEDTVIHHPVGMGPFEDWPLGNSANTPTLVPGQCTTMAISGTASHPSSTAEAFYLGAMVDPDQRLSELFDDNNTRATQRIGMGNKADFIVTAVKGPSSATRDQDITAQVTVCNQGMAPSETNVDVFLSEDKILQWPPGVDERLGGARVPLLAPTQCATLTVSGPATPPSTAPEKAFYLEAIVNSDFTYSGLGPKELIPDNNTRVGNRLALSP